MWKIKSSSKFNRIRQLITRMGSYLVKQGIVYLTLADTRYPQKLAFMFLSEISDSFKAEL